jgi:hypothetical protein
VNRTAKIQNAHEALGRAGYSRDARGGDGEGPEIERCELIRDAGVDGVAGNLHFAVLG